MFTPGLRRLAGPRLPGMTATVVAAPRPGPSVDSADVTTRKPIPVKNEAEAAAVAELKKLGREWARINEKRDAKHAELQDAIIRAATKVGLRPQYIIRATGVARETVFRLLRDQPKPDDA